MRWKFAQTKSDNMRLGDDAVDEIIDHDMKNKKMHLGRRGSFLKTRAQKNKEYVPERASVHGDQPLWYTVEDSWKPHGSQLKGRTQG